MKEPSERYGIEPFRASGKRSPLRGHKSVAPATQEVPRNRFAAGADQRTHAAIGQSNRAHPSSAGVSAVVAALIWVETGIMFPLRHLY